MPRTIPDAPLTVNALPSGRTRKGARGSAEAQIAELDSIVPQFSGQVGAERDPSGLAFTFTDAKHTAIEIHVPHLKPRGFTEPQPGAVENQDQNAYSGARLTVATQALCLGQQRADLAQRKNMGDEVRLRLLGRPLAAGHKPVRIETASVSEELP